LQKQKKEIGEKAHNSLLRGKRLQTGFFILLVPVGMFRRAEHQLSTDYKVAHETDVLYYLHLSPALTTMPAH